MTDTVIELSIANATPKDAQFFRCLTALFTDPALAESLARLHAGECVLQYVPANGAMNILSFIPLNSQNQTN